MPISNSQRINFSGAQYTPNYPDFLDIQIKSFQDFFQLETKSDERNEEGLFNTLKKTFQFLTLGINLFLSLLIILLILQDIKYKSVLKED